MQYLLLNKKLLRFTVLLIFFPVVTFGQSSVHTTQSGNDNNIDIQLVATSNSNANVFQNGNDNEAYVEIFNQSTNITTSIDQLGDFNEAVQLVGAGNTLQMNIKQVGNQNYGKQETLIDPNTSINLQQTGNGNWSKQKATHVDNRQMEVKQTENNNTSHQLSIWGSPSFLSKFITVQDGTGNFAQMRGEANKISLEINQYKTNNWAKIDSRAEDNIAIAIQGGNGNRALINQN